MFITILLSFIVLTRFYAPPSQEVLGVMSTIHVPSPSLVQKKVLPSPTPTSLPTFTPTPTPTSPPAIPTIITNFETYFEQFASQYGVDKELMKQIARCESGFNPESRNGTYGGMFQFAESTWVTTRSEMGKDTNTDLRFSAQDAIETAAFKIGRHGAGAWSGCL